jgi:hypothetical protein
LLSVPVHIVPEEFVKKVFHEDEQTFEVLGLATTLSDHWRDLEQFSSLNRVLLLEPIQDVKTLGTLQIFQNQLY